MLAIVAALLFVGLARAVAPPAPPPPERLGVGSCAGSTCHGRQTPSGAVVRQDEIRLWQDESSPSGAHARAFRVLATPRGRAIAAKLGLGDPQRAPSCLGCHADVPQPGMAAFRTGDGIGCETCHGPAGDWIASHAAVGATRASNMAAGMRDLASSRARAAVCLDCHLGSARGDRFADHRMMAAGHPRLTFEIDLFSTLGQHWNEDKDYAARKPTASHVKLWAIGQAEALARSLSLYSNGGLGQDGSFPQFAFFDCHTCHRRIFDGPDARATKPANPSRPMPAGFPAYQDENMIMLAAAVRVAAPDMAARLDADSRAFHAAITRDRPSAVAAAGRLRATADALATRFSGANMGRDTAFAIVAAVAGDAISPRFTDYEGSVQAVMAVDTLLASLVASGDVSAAGAKAIRPDIDRAYAAVKEPNAYQPAVFRTALGRASGAIGRLR